ncbi:MAG TPA: hypothetical protein VGB17_01020 [Pyrinomonadaceae bacterium]|jgi:hypothetical protein
MKGYVYLGRQLIAQQANSVTWVHQDPVTKSRHLTDNNGGFVSSIELDPWGGETTRSINSSATSQNTHRPAEFQSLQLCAE